MSDTPIRVVNQPASSGPDGTFATPGQPGMAVNSGLDTSVSVAYSLYSEVNGRPYTADKFGLQLYWGDPLFKDIRIDMQTVEDYASRKMYELGLTDTVEAFDEVIKQVTDMINTYENEKPEVLFKRLSSAIKALNRMENAKMDTVALNAETLEPGEYENIYG